MRTSIFEKIPGMLIGRRLHAALIILISVLGFTWAQQARSARQVQVPGSAGLAVRDTSLAPVDDETPVVLPAPGKFDERPFFSSSRHPVIEYPDRQTTERVAELARKVAAGEVRLRFDKD